MIDYAYAYDADVDLSAGVRCQITVAHYADDEFYELGPVTHEVPAAALFAAVPGHTCDPVNDGSLSHCFVLDLLDADECVVTDKHISAEDAEKLLDVALQPALDAARRQWGHL